MKTAIYLFVVLCIFSSAFLSCKDDDNHGSLHFHFYNGGSSYVDSDTTLPAGSTGLIGLEAETEDLSDAITTLKITESVNGGTAATVYEDNTLDANLFGYDYNFEIDSTAASGDTYKYTFKLNSREGAEEEIDLTITVQ